MSLEEVEAFLIKKALARHDGNARKGGRIVRPKPKRFLPAAPAIWAVKSPARRPEHETWPAASRAGIPQTRGIAFPTKAG